MKNKEGAVAPLESSDQTLSEIESQPDDTLFGVYGIGRPDGNLAEFFLGVWPYTEKSGAIDPNSKGLGDLVLAEVTVPITTTSAFLDGQE